MTAQPKARASSHSEARAVSSPAILQLDLEQLLKWARGLGRGVARDCKFIRRGSAEEEELEGVAIEGLVEYVHRYDENQLVRGTPTDHFIKWAGQPLRKLCKRHAEKLRNGGTYRTTDNKQVKEACRVRSLPRCADCSDVSLPWPERDEDDEPEEVPATCGAFEPHIVWMVNGVPKAAQDVISGP